MDTTRMRWTTNMSSRCCSHQCPIMPTCKTQCLQWFKYQVLPISFLLVDSTLTSTWLNHLQCPMVFINTECHKITVRCLHICSMATLNHSTPMSWTQTKHAATNLTTRKEKRRKRRRVTRNMFRSRPHPRKPQLSKLSEARSWVELRWRWPIFDPHVRMKL